MEKGREASRKLVARRVRLGGEGDSGGEKIGDGEKIVAGFWEAERKAAV